MRTTAVKRAAEPTTSAAGSTRRFDGWRVVTGIMVVFALLFSLMLLALAEIGRQQAEDCKAGPHYIAAEIGPAYEGKTLHLASYEDCPDYPSTAYVPAIWALAVAACFAAATIAPFGTWRRGWVIGGTCLLVPPIAVLLGVIALFVALRPVRNRHLADA